MTLAEFAARGALAMFWFQAASVASAGARGESDAGGAGQTVHEPRVPEGAAARGPAGRAVAHGRNAVSQMTSPAGTAVRSQFPADSADKCERGRVTAGWS